MHAAFGLRRLFFSFFLSPVIHLTTKFRLRGARQAEKEVFQVTEARGLLTIQIPQTWPRKGPFVTKSCRLAEWLVAGLGQPETNQQLRHKQEKLCVLLMEEMRNNLTSHLMQQKGCVLKEVSEERLKKHVLYD
eukprot:1153198-Pelagomonas_calceolata.AAC.1